MSGFNSVNQGFLGGGGSSGPGPATTVPISGLLAAESTNSINNGIYTQTWNWALVGGVSGLVLTSAANSANNSITNGILNVALSGNALLGISNETAAVISNSKNILIGIGYGIIASATGTGAGQTNIGGLFTATGGGANNYALRLVDGTELNGRVLTCDDDGNANWAEPTGVTGSGTLNYVPKWSSGSALGNSSIYDDGTNVISSQPFIPSSDNTKDLGLTGTRWRTGYFGTSTLSPITSTNSITSLSGSQEIQYPATLRSNGAAQVGFIFKNSSAADVAYLGIPSLGASGLRILTNGAASTPAITATGTWFTGGTSTTTKPQLLIEPTGTTSTAWSTSGTGLGINAASGFTGNLIDAQLAGVSKFYVDASGNVVTPSTSFANVFRATSYAVAPALYGAFNVADADLTLEGTTSATKTTSYVIIQPTGGNVGIGSTAPANNLVIRGATPTTNIEVTGFTHNFSNTVYSRPNSISASSYWSGTNGGSLNVGISKSSTPALSFFGISDETTPTVSPVYFAAFKRSSGATAALGTSEKAFSFFNGTTGFTTGTELVTILGGGNVGIGTPTPLATLHVLNGGSSEIARMGNGSSVWTLGADGFGGYFQAITASKGVAFYNAAGNTNLKITGGGNITAASVNTTGTGTNSAFSFVANSLTTGNGLDVASSSLTSGNLVNLSNTNGSSTGTTLRVNASAGYAALFETGSVGIGTTSPTAAKLQVTGNGAASVSGGLWDGTWFTGGTATTTKPQLLIEPTGTTSTAWSTSGTGLGVNAASGFTGNLIDAQLNGASRFYVNSTGYLRAQNIESSGYFQLGGSSYIQFAARTYMQSSADGNLSLLANAGGFGLLQFGGTTTSFPAIARNGTGIDIKLADNSAYTNIAALTTRTTAVAFASLPTGVTGMIATVNNSTTNTWGATIAGGGANTVLAFFNGTNWTVIGQ